MMRYSRDSTNTGPDKRSVLVYRVSALMNQKYKWNQGLIVKITPSRVFKTGDVA